MLTIREPAELRREVAARRASGGRVAGGRVADGRAADGRVAFVPTMGALHAGHLSLVHRARELAGTVVASIFVNPAQFGPGEDFASYPRDVEADSALLAEAGCDVLFLPDVATIYPPGHTTWVEVDGPSRGGEGDHRPGHFRGVATVVTKLFNLVGPDVAVFGEKDAQQLAVVRQLVRDLHLPVEVVGAPTVREPDGLAMSSRNAYLSAEERRRAGVLHRALTRAAAAVAAGERRSAEVQRLVREELAREPTGTVDYVAVVDAATFAPIDTLAGRCVVPIAVRFGKTRLLDNLQLDLT